MQLTTTTLLCFASALSSARGMPKAHEILPVEGALLRRATCDTVPSATSNSAQPVATVSAATPLDCQSQCQANTQCKSFVFGTDSTGNVECLLYSVAAAEIPPQDSNNLKAYDTGCTGVSNVAPTTSTNTGAGSGQRSGIKSRTGMLPGGAPRRRSRLLRRNVCGSAPSGTANQNASPVQTLTNVNSATDCLNQCKQVSGCQS